MDRDKVARELVKIAKELFSNDYDYDPKMVDRWSDKAEKNFIRLFKEIESLNPKKLARFEKELNQTLQTLAGLGDEFIDLEDIRWEVFKLVHGFIRSYDDFKSSVGYQLQKARG